MVAEYPTSYRRAGVQSPAGRPAYELPGRAPVRPGFPANYPRGPRPRVDVRTNVPRVPRGAPVPRLRFLPAASAIAAAYRHYRGQQDVPVGPVNEGLPAGVQHHRTFEPHNNSWNPTIYDVDSWQYTDEAGLSPNCGIRSDLWPWAWDAKPDNWLVGWGSPGQYDFPADIPTFPATTKTVMTGWRIQRLSGVWNYYLGKLWTYDPTFPGTAGGLIPMEIPAHVPMPAYAPPINTTEPLPVPAPEIGRYRDVRADQDPFPLDEPEVAPNARPRPRPGRAARPSRGVEIVVRPDGRTTVRPDPFEPLKPPKQGTKEKKGRTPFEIGFSGWADVLGVNPKNAFDMLTEALDILNVTYYSIDEDFRPVAITPQEKAVAIIENFEHIDFDDWAKNVMIMELQDTLLGQANRQAQQGLRDFNFGGTFFGPGL